MFLLCDQLRKKQTSIHYIKRLYLFATSFSEFWHCRLFPNGNISLQNLIGAHKIADNATGLPYKIAGGIWGQRLCMSMHGKKGRMLCKPHPSRLLSVYCLYPAVPKLELVGQLSSPSQDVQEALSFLIVG